MDDKTEILTRIVELRAERDIAHQVYMNICNQIQALEIDLFKGIVAPSSPGLAISMMAKVASGKHAEIYNVSTQEIADRVLSLPFSLRDKTQKVIAITREISKVTKGPAPRTMILDVAELMDITREKTDDILDRMRRDGDMFEPSPGMMKLP